MEQKLYEAANRLPDTNLTLKAIQTAPQRPGFFSRHRRAILAVATTLVLIILCFGGYSVAVEAKTYREAVVFFQANGLSTDGLSRQEIKNVYLDITTKSFTYSKTAQVIRNSLAQEQLGGYQFPQEDPTPEDLENLWNYRNFDGLFVTHTNKGEYRIEQQFDQNRNCTALVHRLDGETLLWTTTIPNFPARKYTAVTDGVIVFGSSFFSASSQTEYGYVAKLSLDGELLWTCRLAHDFHEEDVFAVLENPDGTYAVFSRGDLEQICLSRYSADGEELNFRSTSARDLGTPIAVTHYSGGYLLLAWDGLMLAKMDLQGHITGSFRYEINGYECRISDMTEFGGQILLSGYLWPKLPEGEHAYGRYEIAALLNKIYNDHYPPYDISNGALTTLVRDHYTAVLLVCDPNEGSPQTFYSVRGALGSSIRVDSQGQLIWETENITQAFYSPATSSFTIGGTSYIYRYTFAPNGAFLQKENTGEVVNFRK